MYYKFGNPAGCCLREKNANENDIACGYRTYRSPRQELLESFSSVSLWSNERAEGASAGLNKFSLKRGGEKGGDGKEDDDK